jgi:hypothetical protein
VDLLLALPQVERPGIFERLVLLAGFEEWHGWFSFNSSAPRERRSRWFHAKARRSNEGAKRSRGVFAPSLFLRALACHASAEPLRGSGKIRRG